MQMILAPEERLFIANRRETTATHETPLRRAADRLPAPKTGLEAKSMRRALRAHGTRAARQLQRALAEYHERSESK